MPATSLGSALLVAPGLLVLAVLLAHAWRVKGPRVALAFFASSFVFGLLRGNFIGWYMRDAAAQLGMGDGGGLMPYVMRAPLVRVGYASLFECFGWMLALYLAWTVSEQVLRRVLGIETRLFPLLLLASVFTAALGYAVEAGANALRWWTWTLPLQSKLLVEVPAAGLWAWFSVAPDFLLPFLLLLERPRPGLRWLALLLFPAHMASNLLDLIAARRGWDVLGEPSWLAHVAMLAALVLLAALDRREVSLAAAAREPATGVWRWLPVSGAAIVLGVIWYGLGPMAHRWELWPATSPLLVFILLAIPSVPFWAVAVVGGLCAPLGAGRGLAAATPLLASGLLRMVDRGSRRRLVAVAVAVPALVVVAILWQVSLGRAEKAYLRARMLGGDWPKALARLERRSSSLTALRLRAGNAFASFGRYELAVDAYRTALRLEPDLATAHNGLGLSLLNLGRAKEALDSLEQATRLVPRSEGLHQNLGLAQLATGRLEAAEASFARAQSLAPEDARPIIGRSRVAVAQGRADDAVRILTEALAATPGDVDLHLALGGLHQDASRLDLAERHFRLAVASGSGPSVSIAYCRLAVHLADRPGRLADAQSAAEAAVAHERTDVTLDTLGWVLIRAGQREEARTILAEAVEASSDGPARQRILQHLAEAGGS